MYIVSMTTIPSRKKRLEDNIKSILNQSWQGFDKYCINIDDNLSKEDYEFYDNLKQLDNRIEINVCDHKWRSCNKLLPIIKKYPEAVVITVDDDFDYPKDCLLKLVQVHQKNLDCIVSHETNPIIVKDGKFCGFINGLDVKLLQKDYAKYLSNCCLFPSHVFDNTDVFDYDKMMECTNGCHDELWFWVNSTINGVHVIGLNYVYTFDEYVMSDTYTDGYRLCDINANVDNINHYNEKLIEMYGNKLNEVVGKEKVRFVIDCDNMYSFMYQYGMIKHFYAGNYIVNLQNLTERYKKIIKEFLSKN